MSNAFLDTLTTVKYFSKVCDPSLYQSAPDDWWVLITDIEGSTVAIDAGHYKDVNQLGVATISFVKNLLNKEEFLFVFGGDGATLLLSNTQYESVKDRLVLLEQLGKQRFRLDLRIGAIQVKELSKHGSATVKVAHLEINPKQRIAVFQGGGLTLAETIIKSRPRKSAPGLLIDDPSLDGLSCRWQPLPSNNGKIASLLIACQPDKDAGLIYAEVIKKISVIFGGDIDVANPVNLKKASYSGFFKMLSEETKFHKNIFCRGYLKRSLEIFFCTICFKLKIPLFSTKAYVSAISSHSDYRKFDDTLRMVLDGSSEQQAKLQILLDDLYRENKVFYGIHYSTHAIMTCLVEGLSDGEHIHFIDGSNGGYAMAAKSMKKQMKAC